MTVEKNTISLSYSEEILIVHFEEKKNIDRTEFYSNVYLTTDDNGAIILLQKKTVRSIFINYASHSPFAEVYDPPPPLFVRFKCDIVILCANKDLFSRNVRLMMAFSHLTSRENYPLSIPSIKELKKYLSLK
jgi:hypothetical protein